MKRYNVILCNMRGEALRMYATNKRKKATGKYDAWKHASYGNVVTLLDKKGKRKAVAQTYGLGKVPIIRVMLYYRDLVMQFTPSTLRLREYDPIEDVIPAIEKYTELDLSSYEATHSTYGSVYIKPKTVFG